jgi:hypothetical protein
MKESKYAIHRFILQKDLFVRLIIMKEILINAISSIKFYLVTFIFSFSVLSCNSAHRLSKNYALGKTPVKVIFETDMCTDVDDVGALATLHALADNNEVEILAVCYNEVHKDGASAIDAINTWYNRGDIPIGIYKKTLISPDSSSYLKQLAIYPNDIPDNSDYIPDALSIYKETLMAQPDSSVVIISVGFLNNLEDLLTWQSELIAKKVNKLIIMGGINNDNFNLDRHNLIGSSVEVLKNWPTHIIINELGGDIISGSTLSATPKENPVREAYHQYFKKNYEGRSSWDPITVLFAVRGSSYFNVNSTGTGSLRNGYTYQMKPGLRSYITGKIPNVEFESILNKLMMKPPISRH